MSADRVVGRNPVVEALRAGVPARSLHLAPGLARDDRVREVVALAHAAGIPVHETARARLDRLAGAVPHQGVLLEVAPFRYQPVDRLLADARLLVALDGLTDPHNVGAIARSAAAFGADGLVLPARRAAGVSPAVWKASAGALARLPVAQVTNLTRTLTACADEGFAVVGLAGDGRDLLDALDVRDERVVLVVGAEGRGLSRLVRASCREVVVIPMAGPAESLNASVAAAVALAELARRRRAAPGGGV